MIKNIIFDLGNVLINYNPHDFINKNVKEENREKFFKEIFQSKEWQDSDRGTLEYDEAVKIFSKRVPEERENIKKLFDNDIQDVLFVDKTNIKYLSTLKNKDYKLYILSNFHKNSFRKISEINNFKTIFDGGVISYECHLLKPESNIYKAIIDKYGLIPEETVFIDDSLPNVQAAIKFNIHGIHLKNIKDLIKTLNNTLNI